MSVAKKKQNETYQKRKRKGQFFTESSLVSDIIEIFNLKFDNKKIIEPSCGEGVFINEIKNKNINKIIGVDIDEKVLNNIRKDEKVELINSDFLEYNFKEKFDMIIGNPPFNLPSKEYFDSTEGFISKGIDLLKNNGELILVIPGTVLRHKCYQALREKILNETKIIGIINTSKYDFLGADIETVVIYLKKEKVDKQRYKYFFNNNTIQIELENLNKRKTILLNNTKTYNSICKKIEGQSLGELFEIKRGTKNKSGLQGRMIDFFNDLHIMNNVEDEQFIGIQNIAYRFTANSVQGNSTLVRDTVTRLIPKKKMSIEELRYITNFLNSSIAFYNLHNNCLNNSRLTIHMDKYYIDDFIVPIPKEDNIKIMNDMLNKCKGSMEFSQKRNMLFYKTLNLSDTEINEIEEFWTCPKYKEKSEMSNYE